MQEPNSARTHGSTRGGATIAGARKVLPGIALCAVIALAASFVSEHHGGPTMLYALLLGMAFYFLSKEQKTAPGIVFSSRHILRIGVALLGARITIWQIASLGWTPIVIVLSAVVLTILSGVLLSRWLGLSRNLGILSGGATAICGASAALAISAVLPKGERTDRDTLFTVIAVTTLSTIAMIVYPLLIRAFGMDAAHAGMYLGATIHDVAQVVGAAFMLSDEAGAVATFTKLLRVALLVPAVMVISWIVARGGEGASGGGARLPGFLIAFVAIVAVNSAGLLPPVLQDLMADISRACLVIAITGLGVQTSFQELAQIGWRPVILVVGETLFLAIFVLLLLLFVPF